MKAKAIANFASQFGVEIALNPDLVIEKNGRYFLVNEALRPFVQRDFYYAGVFLGKVKGGKFFPSFNLLNMLVDIAVNKVVLDRKSAWLFICGRDVFSKGMLKVFGSKRKGAAVLVLNEFGECLGFGRIMSSSSGFEGELAVKNVLDVGDFLRREKGRF